ncbi:MAG: hypothetical protein KGJ47_05090 [Acidobacteriota bacterium]|nr:hypothetical protein [Acidobacteriota bacterium]
MAKRVADTSSTRPRSERHLPVDRARGPPSPSRLASSLVSTFNGNRPYRPPVRYLEHAPVTPAPL